MNNTSYTSNLLTGEVEKRIQMLTLAGKYTVARKLLNQLLTATDPNDSLTISNIYTKLGNTYNQQWKFKDAAALYQKAELSLLNLHNSQLNWEKWIDLQIDYCYVLMNLRKEKSFHDRKRKLKFVIDVHGNNMQKIKYSHVIFTDLLWKNKWFQLPDETFMICESIIAIAERENYHQVKLGTQNLQAFATLFHHDYAKARTIATSILDAIIEDGFGEEAIRAYCTICFSYRKEGDIEKAKEWIKKAYQLAACSKNEIFNYLMDSISAWIHLKEGDFKCAKKYAQNSYDGMANYRYPFLSFSLLPLIAIHIKENKTHKAIQYAFRLLAPNQQKIPDNINLLLKTAIMYWGKNDITKAKLNLEEAIKLADNKGFL